MGVDYTESLKKEKQKIDQQQNSIIKEKDKSTNIRQNEHTHPLILARKSFVKKRFSIMLYPEEYDALMENIKTNGYRKTEYFLACVNAAKKQNMNSLYNRYLSDHKKRKIEERNLINQIKQDNVQSAN